MFTDTGDQVSSVGIRVSKVENCWIVEFNGISCICYAEDDEYTMVFHICRTCVCVWVGGGGGGGGYGLTAMTRHGFCIFSFWWGYLKECWDAVVCKRRLL
ncbi:hypothetical protein Hanom_Chr09g00814031 [Helianthus anomalus]